MRTVAGHRAYSGAVDQVGVQVLERVPAHLGAVVSRLAAECPSGGVSGAVRGLMGNAGMGGGGRSGTNYGPSGQQRTGWQ